MFLQAERKKKEDCSKVFIAETIENHPRWHSTKLYIIDMRMDEFLKRWLQREFMDNRDVVPYTATKQ
jgi:hypothetical protein